jgi:hypothetical protein
VLPDVVFSPPGSGTDYRIDPDSDAYIGAFVCGKGDLNPIEQLFARLKSFLRKMKARTVEELWRAIASFLKSVSKEECNAYLANSGYA